MTGPAPGTAVATREHRVLVACVSDGDAEEASGTARRHALSALRDLTSPVAPS